MILMIEGEKSKKQKQQKRRSIASFFLPFPLLHTVICFGKWVLTFRSESQRSCFLGWTTSIGWTQNLQALESGTSQLPELWKINLYLFINYSVYSTFLQSTPTAWKIPQVNIQVQCDPSQNYCECFARNWFQRFYKHVKTWLSGIILKRGAMMKNLDFNFLRLHVIYSVCVYVHTKACLWKFRGQLLVAESLLPLCGSRIEFTSSGLVAGTVTHWAILPALGL